MLALLLAAAVILPAEPVGIAAGDVDRDGKAELALLLVYPAWSSTSQITSVPGGAEVNVVSAIQDRRELRIFRLGTDGPLLAAEPLSVGREVLGIDAGRCDGPVVVLTDAGVSRLSLEKGEGPLGKLTLEPIMTLPPLFAGAERFWLSGPLVADVDGDGTDEIMVPTLRGTAVVRLDGTLCGESSTPLRRVWSGSSGGLRQTVPRLVDTDRDATPDLLDIDWSGFTRAAVRRGLGRGRFAEPVTWDMSSLVEMKTIENNEQKRPRLVDVQDGDQDGTLEALTMLGEESVASVGAALDAMRGVKTLFSFHALKWDGTVEAGPEITFRAEVTDEFPVDKGREWGSSLIDLDRDNRPEWVGFSMEIGYFGVARALVSGVGKAKVQIHLFRRGDGGYSELKNAVPPLTFKINLRQGELMQYASFPGDIDGDGLIDLAVVDGDEIRVHLGQIGPRFAEKPSHSMTLAPTQVRGGYFVRWVDLDGDRALDAVAFEKTEAMENDPAKPVRMEVRWPRREMKQ